MNRKEQFLKDAENKAFDLEHRRKLLHNIGQYDKKVVQGKSQFVDLNAAREQAKNIKWATMEKLDHYLLMFERNISARGGQVIWAEDGEEAVQAVLDICKKKNLKTAVKSKSMVTEEIHLNDHLEKNDISVLETDLGEYIVQLEGSRPYHIVTPVMQKSKEDVADLFHKKFDTAKDSTPEFLTKLVRKQLRSEYPKADLGITGGNFLVADTGSVVVVTNEGNARLSTAFPKVHIAIVGIEKIIPSINDLELFLPLLSTYGTGQRVTVYNSIFNGPKQKGETDGPEEMYVILLDNGRTNILAQKDKRESLYCIRCGSCLNACPIYKNVGGHTYETVYSGPIGSVISPQLNDLQEHRHLSESSSLCGNCTASCPLKINIHEMLLYNRRDASSQESSFSENLTWKVWRTGMLNRSLMNMGGGLKNMGFKNIFEKSWGKRRAMPEFPKKTFNQLWKKLER